MKTHDSGTEGELQVTCLNLKLGFHIFKDYQLWAREANILWSVFQLY